MSSLRRMCRMHRANRAVAWPLRRGSGAVSRRPLPTQVWHSTAQHRPALEQACMSQPRRLPTCAISAWPVQRSPARAVPPSTPSTRGASASPLSQAPSPPLAPPSQSRAGTAPSPARPAHCAHLHSCSLGAALHWPSPIWPAADASTPTAPRPLPVPSRRDNRPCTPGALGAVAVPAPRWNTVVVSVDCHSTAGLRVSCGSHSPPFSRHPCQTALSASAIYWARPNTRYLQIGSGHPRPRRTPPLGCSLCA